MDNLKSAYLKKALFFPLVVIAVLLILAAVFVPTIISRIPVATDKTEAVKVYDASQYDFYLKDYDSFEDLRLNRFIGWLSSDDIALGCPVSFASENEDTDLASLLEGSTEPWNNGCVVIIGDNTDQEFRNLHKAGVGDKVTVDFHSNDSYTYKITETYMNKTKDEINDYKRDNTLIMCRPYKNFAKDGDFYYAVYVADLIEEWGEQNGKTSWLIFYI